MSESAEFSSWMGEAIAAEFLALLLSAVRGLLSMLDATDRSTAPEDHAALEEALDEVCRSQDHLRTIIDTIPALVWCFRPDGTANYFLSLR